MYVCRAQDEHPRSHCAEQALHQCDYCQCYEHGHGKAHYPVPVTASTAALSVYHQDGSPDTIWPYRMVKKELKYLD